MRERNTRFEMRFAGSGGQGVILCSIILAEAGKKILSESGLNITAAEDMADGARKACRLVKEARA